MSDSRIVYSTEFGRMCPECQKPVSQCICSKNKKHKKLKEKRPIINKSGFPDDGVVRITRQTKGFKGKTATIVVGVLLEGPELKQFVKLLKQRCGSGGTIKDGVIIIQGDHRDTLLSEIKKQGYIAKIASG